MAQAARGATALAAGQHAEAITCYTNAISQNPKAVDYFLKRSIAYQRSSPPRLDEALADAEHAVLLAIERAKRELIAEAQLRRAIILFTQERYADAQFVFGIVKKLNEKEKTLGIWEMKTKAKLKALKEGDSRAQITVTEKPERRAEQDKAKDASASQTSNSKVESVKSVEPTPPSKIKHDWYQTNDKVYFTLLAKGVPKDLTAIDIEVNSLNISFPTQTESTYEYSIEPLYAPIDPIQSTHSITATKVEVTLKKSTPGVKWHALEGTTSAGVDGAEPASASIAMRQAVLATDKAPSYPTSSKTGPKDWDKLASNLMSKSSSAAKKSTETANKTDESKATKTNPQEAEDDYDYDDDEGGDPAGAFFRKLYKGADPDTQRAMMKSYQESNGTVLSTNWSDIGKRTVETQPPDGMEEKKWGK